MLQGGLLLCFLSLRLGLVPTLQQTYRSINRNLKDRTFIQYMCEKTRQKTIRAWSVEKRELECREWGMAFCFPDLSQ